MPKRPCAIAITNDDTTIICGDKFGDIYALPLIMDLPTPNDDPQQVSQEESRAPRLETTTGSSASGATVHTARNRRALKDQSKKSNKALEEKGPKFPYQLILGHVSMVTDLALATIGDESSSDSNVRNYIMTCDRDEHIRVSRGLPQSHIIEAYCLGHKQFVSRVVIPEGRQDILISGGGDDFLYVWNWASGLALHEVNLCTLVKDFLDKHSGLREEPDIGSLVPQVSGPEETSDGRESLSKDAVGKESSAWNANLSSSSRTGRDICTIAVSGMWTFCDATTDQVSTKANVKVLVACEG